MIVKSGNTLRRNERCAGRPMENLPNGQNVALNHTLSLSRTCGSVQAGDHCCPRGIVPLPPYAVMETNPVVVHGRKTAPSLPCPSGCDAHMAVLFSPPRDGLSILEIYGTYQTMAEDHARKSVDECHPYREFEGMQPSR